MKNYYFFLVALCTFAQARVGCLHNSLDLARSGDTKEYHLVSCNCLCEKDIRAKMLPDGTCSKCRHRHTHTFVFNKQELAPTRLLNIKQLQQLSAQSKRVKAKITAKKTS